MAAVHASAAGMGPSGEPPVARTWPAPSRPERDVASRTHRRASDKANKRIELENRGSEPVRLNNVKVKVKS